MKTQAGAGMIGDSNRNRDYSKTRVRVQVRARKAREKNGSGSVNLRSRQATLEDCDNANAHDSTCNKLASVFASGELAIRDSVEQAGCTVQCLPPPP